MPKNDYVDSFVIADCLRFGRINKKVYIGEYHYKALQNLTRARYFAVCNLTKEKQRFMNVLFKKYSTMTQEKVFSDTFSTTALAVFNLQIHLPLEHHSYHFPASVQYRLIFIYHIILHFYSPVVFMN